MTLVPSRKVSSILEPMCNSMVCLYSDTTLYRTIRKVLMKKKKKSPYVQTICRDNMQFNKELRSDGTK